MATEWSGIVLVYFSNVFNVSLHPHQERVSTKGPAIFGMMVASMSSFFGHPFGFTGKPFVFTNKKYIF